MVRRIGLIVAVLLIAACGDDSGGSSPSVAHLTISARPLEDLVDHGWADVDGKVHRMEFEGDSLVVRHLRIPLGQVVIDVRAVDANESDLRAGIAFGEVLGDIDSALVQVPLSPSRSDLRLAGLSWEPEDPVAGEDASIITEVANDGSGSSGPTSLTVRVGAESQGEQFDVPAMLPGQKLRFEREVEFTQAGVYQVLAFVDPRNRVPEVINTNNAAIGLVSVGPAP